MAYAMKLDLHVKLANGGSAYRYALVDFPGIYMETVRETRASDVVRAFVFDGESYDTVDKAVDAWMAAPPEVCRGRP